MEHNCQCKSFVTGNFWCQNLWLTNTKPAASKWNSLGNTKHSSFSASISLPSFRRQRIMLQFFFCRHTRLYRYRFAISRTKNTKKHIKSVHILHVQRRQRWRRLKKQEESENMCLHVYIWRFRHHLALMFSYAWLRFIAPHSQNLFSQR